MQDEDDGPRLKGKPNAAASLDDEEMKSAEESVFWIVSSTGTRYTTTVQMANDHSGMLKTWLETPDHGRELKCADSAELKLCPDAVVEWAVRIINAEYFVVPHAVGPQETVDPKVPGMLPPDTDKVSYFGEAVRLACHLDLTAAEDRVVNGEVQRFMKVHVGRRMLNQLATDLMNPQLVKGEKLRHLLVPSSRPQDDGKDDEEAAAGANEMMSMDEMVEHLYSIGTKQPVGDLARTRKLRNGTAASGGSGKKKSRKPEDEESDEDDEEDL